jgi:hypothetical protein
VESPYQGDPGGLVGRVVDENGQPVSDADVQVVGQPRARVISSQQGRFRIDDVEPGLLEVQFDRLGYTSRTAQFVVQDGRTAELEVVMPTQAIELEPISVTVRPRYLEDRGFYERRDRGFGAHFDRQELERINPVYLSDVVDRVPGVIVTDPQTSDPSGRGSTVGAPSYAINPRVVSLPGAANRPSVCRLELFIDGVRMADQDLTQIDPAHVEAVEVYEGGNGPIEYQQMNPCGVILVWTRR